MCCCCCGSNCITSKELSISLYRLPREEVLGIAWKREKLPADENVRVCYAVCILKKNALNEIYRYTAFICSLIYIP